MENTPNNNAPKAAQPQQARQPKARATANNLQEQNRQNAQQPRRKHFFRRRPQQNNRNGGMQSRPSGRPMRKTSPTQKMVSSISGLIGKSLSVIIPWIILSTLVFSAGAYFIFNAAVEAHPMPFWYTALLCLFIFGVYGLFGLLFGITMAMLYSLKIFSESFGSVIKEAVNRVKSSIESKLDNISETLSQNDIASVVKQTFAELSYNVRKYSAPTAAGFFAVAALAGVLFVARKAFLKSISSVKNRAEFFAVLSARVTLVLAVILNLALFSRVAVAVGYLIGLIAILSQVIAFTLIK